MKRWRFALASFISILALAVVFPAVVSGQEMKSGKTIEIRGPKYLPGEVMVRFRPGVPGKAKAEAHAAVQGQTVKKYHIVPGLELVRLPKGMSVEEAVSRYERNPNVLHAHPSYLKKLEVIPDDALFGEQWGLNNTGQTGGTPDADIDTPEAWNLTKGSKDVVVAIIDSGVDYNHEDLAANMFRNEADCNANGIDDDGNGYPDDCHGIDTYNNDSDPMDDYGHGTHVAGIIGAVGNNGTGIAGVNWNVSFMACKALGTDGFLSDPAAIACMEYIADMRDRGVNIVAVNASYGGQTPPDPDEEAAIAQLQQRGILFVASSGDEYMDNDRVAHFPSGYPLLNIISVTATDKHDYLSSTSANVGRYTVDLGAPGIGIMSTMVLNNALGMSTSCPPDALYCSLTGTSMAAPHVAGVAALLKAYNSSLDWKAIKNLTLAGGDDKSDLFYGRLGYYTVSGNRLNAFGSLTCSNSTVLSRLQPASSGVTTVEVGGALDLAVLNINCGQPNGEVQVLVNPGGGVITLLDDGNGPDQVAGDGIYSGRFIPSDVATYTLTFPDDDVHNVLTVHSLKKYRYALVPYNYRDITGSNLFLEDERGLCRDLPIEMSGLQIGGLYLPVPLQICIGSNGVLSFPNLYNTYRNDPIPQTYEPLLIAPFWDDLKGEGENNVYWDVLGTEPNRELVIEWRNVSHYDPNGTCTSADAVKFQVVLFENKDQILFNYADTSFGKGCVDGSADGGGSATVGIQIGPGSGTQYSYNTASLTDNMSILWSAGSLAVSPSSLDFGAINVGATSPVKTLTLNNESGGTLSISDIVVTGDFAKQGDTCTGSLAADAICTVDLTFTPSAAGTRDGELTITSTAPESPQKVHLTGVGQTPGVALSPAILEFGPQKLGSSSDPKAVTLTNDGGATLTDIIISTSGDFTQTNTCNSLLNPSQSCAIKVTFTPTGTGALEGKLTVTSNAESSPDTVELSGEGMPAPVVSLSPSDTLDMGTQKVGTTSLPKNVLLTNPGTPGLYIASIQATAPFAQSNDCGSSLAANASCTIQVTFTPATTAPVQGLLTISTNAEGSPHQIVLTGSGTESVVIMEPSSLNFGKHLITTSETQPVTLRNSGSADLMVASVGIYGDAEHFQYNGQDCMDRNPIGPAEACTINLTFNPHSPGTKTITLQVASDAPGSPHELTVTGRGTDFSVGQAPDQPSSVTVNAGQSASYNLFIAPIEGFEGDTALTCAWTSAQPRGASCSVPDSAKLDGTNAANVIISVTTTARSMAPIGWQPQPPGQGGYPVSHLAMWLLSLAALASLALRSRRVTITLASTLFLVVLWTACGGGSSSPTTSTPVTGTPAGTYSLSVSATASGVAHSTDLALVVK